VVKVPVPVVVTGFLAVYFVILIDDGVVARIDIACLDRADHVIYVVGASGSVS
jgi:hypothetical protein